MAVWCGFAKDKLKSCFYLDKSQDLDITVPFGEIRQKWKSLIIMDSTMFGNKKINK